MKNSIVLEISHKFIKLAMGYVKDEEVYVNFIKKVPINHLLENGMIKEKQELIKELSKINPVVDDDYQINQLINNINFVLPPYGLEVYQTKQMTSVISPEKEIGELDIKNLYSIIRNKRLPVDNDLIDIIPEAFAIDNGNMYAQSPIGKISSAITAFTKVHTLPKRINQDYSEVVKSANININRKVVSTFASTELIGTYKDLPETYFLVDIGSDTTSISLVGKKQLFASRSFPWGGGNITDRIMSRFNISETEAEKIKTLYGLDKRELKFNYYVSTSTSEEGTKKHSVEEFNQLIETELDELYKSMNVAIEKLAQLYKVVDYQKMPILLIGGGSRLKGLVPYLQSKNSYNDIQTITPRSLGARDPSLFAVVGAIYTESKYPNTSEPEAKNNVNVSRED